MGVTGNFLAVPDEDIRAVLERPQRVTRLLYGDNEAETDIWDTGHPNVHVVTILPRSVHRGFRAVRSLLGRIQQQTSEADPWRPSTDREELYVDKAWQGIHFLLTGNAMGGEPPLNFIVGGGTWTGDVETGAHALMNEDVVRLAEALESVPPDQLAHRFDPEKMMELEVYPETWDRDPEEESVGYLISYYTDLRDFVRRTADRGFGLIVCVA